MEQTKPDGRKRPRVTLVFVSERIIDDASLRELVKYDLARLVARSLIASGINPKQVYLTPKRRAIGL